MTNQTAPLVSIDAKGANPSTRTYCPHCQLPLSTCLCSVIKTVITQHQIIILQHPSETKHSKGSARLVDLCIDNAKIVVGETAADFESIAQQLAQQTQACYLVYPQPNSKKVETLACPTEPLTLIFIDGTWKKALKILKLNPWLTKIPSLTFANPPKSAYQIRKAPRNDSLSTLEAVACCLDLLDNTDTKPLTAAFEAMIDTHWRHMNDEIRLRYRDR